MGKPEEIPIIESLTTWLLGQNQQLECSVSDDKHYVNLHHGATWLGVVTLIFPGQDQHQGLQYDWYPHDHHWPLINMVPDARYYRAVWRLADPSSFPEILARAVALRDGSPVKWPEVYRPSETGLKLVEAESA